MLERQVLICECNSLEHQIIFWYDKDEKELYCEPHLSSYNNFFKRLILGIKYIFGYKSKFGNWDETIFKPEELNKLYKHLKDNYETTNS